MGDNYNNGLERALLARRGTMVTAERRYVGPALLTKGRKYKITNVSPRIEISEEHPLKTIEGALYVHVRSVMIRVISDSGYEEEIGHLAFSEFHR